MTDTVYVVVAQGLKFDAPMIFGVYRTRAGANLARRQANQLHNRTPNTSGAFSIERRRLEPHTP